MNEELDRIMRPLRSLLMPHYGNAAAVKYKSDKSVDAVTELDLQVEAYLKEKLTALTPGAEFVGEENGGDYSDNFWLVDPIDGTAHFMRGMPFCSVMAALIQGGEVVASAIYRFTEDELYLAEKGKGATKNGKSIHVSDRDLQDSYLGWESRLNREGHLEKFMELRKRSMLFKTISAGYELAMIAEGRLEGRVCFDAYGYDHDYAPGALLVSEAGGRIANIGQSTYDYRNTDFIAANPKVFKELTEGEGALFKTV